MVLTPEQLSAIGFEEKDGNQYFVNILEDHQYKYVFELKDRKLNSHFYDKTDDMVSDKDYYPVLIANQEGKFHFSNYNKNELYNPLIAIRNQHHTFYFTFTNDLSNRLSGIENLKDYVIRDVQYLEQMLEELENKKSKKE